MKVLIVGGDSFIAKHLIQELNWLGHDVISTSRRRGTENIYYDLLHADRLPEADAVYLCAAMTRFIDCEDNRDGYRINVDAPARIAAMHPWKVIYLSSEAVERALHTTYGMHKALCEIALAPFNPVIARLSKVTNGPACAAILANMMNKPPGLYRL